MRPLQDRKELQKPLEVRSACQTSRRSLRVTRATAPTLDENFSGDYFPLSYYGLYWLGREGGNLRLSFQCNLLYPLRFLHSNKGEVPPIGGVEVDVPDPSDPIDCTLRE